METSLEALPAGFSFLTLHSGLSRQLTDGAYNERRAQCEAAASALGLPSLRTATMEQVEALPDPRMRPGRGTWSARTSGCWTPAMPCAPAIWTGSGR